MTSTDQHPEDLREYIRVLRARKFDVGIVAVLLVAATMFLSFRQTPVYEGQAKVLVKPIQGVGGTGATSQAPNLDTERELILSQAVATQVQTDLDTQTPVKTLLLNARVQVVTDTEVLVVKYDDPDPANAARLANAFAVAYVTFRSEQTQGQFDAAGEAVQVRIDDIQTNLTELRQRIDGATDPALKDSLQSQRDTYVAELGVLEQRLLDLRSNASVAGSAAQIVQQSDVPTSPISPNKVRNGALALFAGLALGVGFAFLRERLDDRVKSRQEFEKRLGAPVLAAVPRVSGWRNREEVQLIMRTDPRSPVSEAYRTLGTNIQYLASQQPLKVLMVTSSIGGDGKSTTSANLGVVLAQAGKRVILISADLRRPRVHFFFGVRNDAGLSNILADAMTLAQVAKDPGIVNLRVVSGGPIPQDPAALLGSRRAAEFIQSIREVSDFVIIDTPPVLAVADASILAPLVDGTIFVMNAEHASRSALIQARDQLDNAGANIVGAVFNNFDPGRSSSYPYTYHDYYYQYYSGEEGTSNGNGSKLRKRIARRSKGKSFERVAKAALR
jgi:capsular exopolysaccharide synthesis family protein